MVRIVHDENVKNVIFPIPIVSAHSLLLETESIAESLDKHSRAGNYDTFANDFIIYLTFFITTLILPNRNFQISLYVTF